MISLNFSPSGHCLYSWSYGPFLTSFQVLASVFTSPSFFYDLCMLSCFSHVQLFENPWTVGRQDLPEFAQTHVHLAVDAIQPSHPLSSPSPSVFNPSQHQGLFQWVSSSHQVAKVLELQHESFQWIFRTDLLAIQGTLKSLLQQYSSKA